MRKLLIMLCAFLLAAVPVAAQGYVRFVPDQRIYSVLVGQTFAVQVWCRAPGPVQALDLHLSYDRTHVEFVSAGAGAGLPVLIAERHDDAAGTLDAGLMRYVTPVQGEFHAVTFTFRVRPSLPNTRSRLTMRSALVVGPYGEPIYPATWTAPAFRTAPALFWLSPFSVR